MTDQSYIIACIILFIASFAGFLRIALECYDKKKYIWAFLTFNVSLTSLMIAARLIWRM
jgi:hypothetical protein